MLRLLLVGVVSICLSNLLLRFVYLDRCCLHCTGHKPGDSNLMRLYESHFDHDKRKTPKSSWQRRCVKVNFGRYMPILFTILPNIKKYHHCRFITWKYLQLPRFLTCFVLAVPKFLMYMSYSLTGGRSNREKVMEKSKSIRRRSSSLRFLQIKYIKILINWLVNKCNLFCILKSM